MSSYSFSRAPHPPAPLGAGAGGRERVVQRSKQGALGWIIVNTTHHLVVERSQPTIKTAF